MDNINTTNVTPNATTGNLFRECGDGGDATIPGATFMNGVMMEIITAIRNSCQTPMAFDANDPDSYSQLWQAIQRTGGTDGVDAWSSGTSSLVVTAGGCNESCNLYIANPSGSPSVNNPSSSTGHWDGPYCSLAGVIEALQKQRTCIDSAADACGTLSAVKFMETDPATGCGVFVKAEDSDLAVAVTDNFRASSLVPADVSAVDDYYAWGVLGSDLQSDSVDQTKLD